MRHMGHTVRPVRRRVLPRRLALLAGDVALTVLLFAPAWAHPSVGHGRPADRRPLHGVGHGLGRPGALHGQSPLVTHALSWPGASIC